MGVSRSLMKLDRRSSNWVRAVRFGKAETRKIVERRSSKAKVSGSGKSITISRKKDWRGWRKVGDDENENYSEVERSLRVGWFVVCLQMRVVLDNTKWSYFGGFTLDKQRERRERTASWLRELCLELGPTFIKLGQLSSTRSDLLPPEFIHQLSKLQDRVPYVSAEKARGIIESQLGAPIAHLFKEFEDRPIASASLGQVHRAVLHNREKVVVKVQRPGLKRLFDIDLKNLKLIAQYFQASETFSGATRDWIAIYQECERILYQEIDYINEAKNTDTFRRNFRNINWVRVPAVFWDYTASKVLTMEYLPGIKIIDLNVIDSRGYSRSQIASLLTKSYLIQVLEHGFFHADPHPGNLAISVDRALIYYDFGMMGEITSITRQRLLNLLYAVHEKDLTKVIKCLIALEGLKPTSDISSVRRSLQFFLEHSQIHEHDHQRTLNAIGEDLFTVVNDQSLQLPSTITFVLKAFSTLEGVSYTLDPTFSFLKVAAPYAQELIIKREQHRTQRLEDLRKQADDVRTWTTSMPYKVQQIHQFMSELESGELKLGARVLESERAAKRSSRMQMATMYAVLGSILVELGVTLTVLIEGSQAIANVSFFGAGVCMMLFLWSMQKVKHLDEFEKMI